MHFDPAAMRETFRIPESVIPTALLVMGYPDKDAKPLDLHAATRPLDEVVRYDSFS
jgi:nitroreductase